MVLGMVPRSGLRSGVGLGWVGLGWAALGWPGPAWGCRRWPALAWAGFGCPALARTQNGARNRPRSSPHKWSREMVPRNGKGTKIMVPGNGPRNEIRYPVVAKREMETDLVFQLYPFKIRCIHFGDRFSGPILGPFLGTKNGPAGSSYRDSSRDHFSGPISRDPFLGNSFLGN